jgi:hypothetical protein
VFASGDALSGAVAQSVAIGFASRRNLRLPPDVSTVLNVKRNLGGLPWFAFAEHGRAAVATVVFSSMPPKSSTQSCGCDGAWPSRSRYNMRAQRPQVSA